MICCATDAHSRKHVTVKDFSSVPVTLAPAQSIFIVDEQGGPGSHFTDLPAAVAAVPSGSTLRVRPGSYTAPAITGKALSPVSSTSAM